MREAILERVVEASTLLDRAEVGNRLCSVAAPSRPTDLESLGDQGLARGFDDAASDRGVVVHGVWIVHEVALVEEVLGVLLDLASGPRSDLLLVAFGLLEEPCSQSVDGPGAVLEVVSPIAVSVKVVAA